jgi:hypothetical protein
LAIRQGGPDRFVQRDLLLGSPGRIVIDRQRGRDSREWRGREFRRISNGDVPLFARHEREQMFGLGNLRKDCRQDGRQHDDRYSDPASSHGYECSTARAANVDEFLRSAF